MRRKRKLYENAVDLWITVQGLDQRLKLGLLNIGAETMGLRMHAGGKGLLAFVADVDGACWILADKDHRQARLQSRRRRSPYVLGHFIEEPQGEGLTVDDRRGAWLDPTC